MTNEILIKRLRYQSWHRGCRETDLLLGQYADKNLHSMTDAELDLFDHFLNEDDWDIYHWFTNDNTMPKKYRSLFND